MSDPRCHGCSAPVPPSARFCPACGVPQGQPEVGERRVVTVVFADLAGFTGLAEGQDPEAVKGLLDACFAALVPVIDAHGGTVDKIIGDELMAVFGVPRSHEDDAERAVRAALELIPTLASVDPSLELRVGVNTGEVLAGPVGPGGASTVTGDTVNTAHRLVEAAGPGEVLVGERTHVATVGSIRYGEATELVLRGRSEPVRAHRARGAAQPAGWRSPAPAAVPLVGRTEELGRVVDAVAAAASSRTPLLLTVVGEAGVGKTRLLAELPRALWDAGTDAAVLTVPCPAYGDAGPLTPLLEVVRQLLEVDAVDDPAVAAGQVERALDRLTTESEVDRGHLRTRVLQLLGLRDLPERVGGPAAPGRSRVSTELVAAARLVLEAAARIRPVVVVFDDIHFADPAVAELLPGIGRWGAGLPIAVVAVGRLDLAEIHPMLLRAADPGHLVFRLEPLEADDSAVLLLQTLGEVDRRPVGTLAADAVGEIVRASGGNPLLLDQMARFLRETGAVVPVDGGWEATRDLAEVGLPDGARALLGARLDALPPRERRLLQGAAIVGRVFDAEAVAALGIDVDDELLVRVWRRGLLSVGATDGELAFRHAMVREAAYLSVALSERALQHERLADWLSARPEEDRTADLVAHHLDRAVALSAELGSAPEALLTRAGGCFLEAGRAARARDDLRTADRWYGRARALDVLDDRTAVAAALEHGGVLLTLRRLRAAAEVFDALLADALDLRVTGEACTGRGVVARLEGDTEGATAWFDAGQRAWAASGDGVGEAGSLRTRGWAELVAGRPRAARTLLWRALELEEVVGDATGVTLQCLAWAEYLIGDHAAARDHLWTAAQALAKVGDRHGLAWCFGILGNSLLIEGQVEQARSVAEGLLQHEGQADPWAEGMCRILLAGCWFESGALEPARSAATAARRTFSDLGDRWGTGQTLLLEGMIERVAGHLDTARDVLQEGLAVAGEVDDLGAEARIRAELAATLLDLGDEQQAAAQARATLTIVRGGAGDRDSEIRALVVLAKRARALADDAGAARLLDEAVTLAAGEVPTSIWRRAVAFSALVAADAGDVDRAGSLAEMASTDAYESARTWVMAQRARAAARAAAGDRDGAAAALAEVRDRFDGRPLAFVEVARRELQALGIDEARPA